MHLAPSDQELLQLVSKAAFLNPFGQERERVDARIAQTAPDDPEVLERLTARVAARLVALLEDGGATVCDYRDLSDRDLLEHAILFDAFHRFAEPMDRLIEDQLAAGNEPTTAPFADDLLSLLRRRGFEPQRSVRMFALLYQMRRAFRFIAQGLVGRSASMRRLRESLWNAVFTHDIRFYEKHLWDRMQDFSTILLGETGTGKGAAAEAIGLSGFIAFDEKRKCFEESFTGLLVPINLSQFPESLIESELFGHRKGAFTGAVDSHGGIFSRCSRHGAIFLDEIGEVEAPTQIKLLRVLQDRVFSPVGSREEKRFDGRVIAATHRSLSELRREQRFRNDFYYRLTSEIIEVPTLRQRLDESEDELGDLLSTLVPRLIGNHDESQCTGIVSTVRHTIDRDLGREYSWPGNVREVEQCVRRILLTQRCAPDPLVQTSGAVNFASLAESGTLTVDDLVARYCTMLYSRLGTYVEVAEVTGLDRRTVRKHIVQQANTEEAPVDTTG